MAGYPDSPRTPLDVCCAPSGDIRTLNVLRGLSTRVELPRKSAPRPVGVGRRSLSGGHRHRHQDGGRNGPGGRAPRARKGCRLPRRTPHRAGHPLVLVRASAPGEMAPVRTQPLRPQAGEGEGGEPADQGPGIRAVRRRHGEGASGARASLAPAPRRSAWLRSHAVAATGWSAAGASGLLWAGTQALPLDSEYGAWGEHVVIKGRVHGVGAATDAWAR